MNPAERQDGEDGRTLTEAETRARALRDKKAQSLRDNLKRRKSQLRLRSETVRETPALASIAPEPRD